MDKKAYGLTVLEQVYLATAARRLKWDTSYYAWISAEPAPDVRFRMSFEDVGPDSAEWTVISISHPVGYDTIQDGEALRRDA